MITFETKPEVCPACLSPLVESKGFTYTCGFRTWQDFDGRCYVPKYEMGCNKSFGEAVRLRELVKKLAGAWCFYSEFSDYTCIHCGANANYYYEADSIEHKPNCPILEVK